MGWGSALKDAWATASSFGRQAIQGLGSAAIDAGESATNLAKRGVAANINGAQVVSDFAVDVAKKTLEIGGFVVRKNAAGPRC